MPFICTICEAVAFEKWNQLRAHLIGKHREEKEQWPSKEDCEISEVPENIRFVKAPKKKVLLGEEEQKPAVGYTPEELSSDAKHLHDLLLLHGVKSGTVDVIVNLYDRLDLYKDPRNLANLLKQRLERKEQYAIVPTLFEMYPERKEELPYIVPVGEGGAPWYSQGQPGYGYAPRMGGMPGAPGYPPTGYPSYPPFAEKSSLDKYIEFQMSREITEEKEKKVGVNPEIDSRLGRIESVLDKMISEKDEEVKESKAVSSVKGEIAGLKSTINKLFEDKEKEALIKPLIDKIELMEKAHKDEMSRLVTELEAKKGKGEETDWLRVYMDERDKRHDEETKRYREDLNKLTSEISKAREREGIAYKEAWHDFTADKEKFEQAKEKARDELLKSGYSSRNRDFEERVLDIVENQAAPALIGEVKEGRKTLQDIAKKVGIGAEAETKEVSPLSDEEASKLSKVMSLEEQMKDLASK